MGQALHRSCEGGVPNSICPVCIVLETEQDAIISGVDDAVKDINYGMIAITKRLLKGPTEIESSAVLKSCAILLKKFEGAAALSEDAEKPIVFKPEEIEVVRLLYETVKSLDEIKDTKEALGSLGLVIQEGRTQTDAFKTLVMDLQAIKQRLLQQENELARNTFGMAESSALLKEREDLLKEREARVVLEEARVQAHEARVTLQEGSVQAREARVAEREARVAEREAAMAEGSVTELLNVLKSPGMETVKLMAKAFTPKIQNPNS